MSKPQKPQVPPVVLSDANRAAVAQLMKRTTIKKPLKIVVSRKKRASS